MNIKTFIDQVGAQDVAKMLGVSQRAVYAWRDGSRTPRPEIVARIVAATPVSYAGIYNAEVCHGSQEIERPRDQVTG